MYILLGIIALLILFAVFYFSSQGKGVQSDSADDAKMFVRLLVSEIKLYNEKKSSARLAK